MKTPYLPPTATRPKRGAYTLVELMIVMGIIVTLAAIALPSVKTILKSHKSSQAATGLVVQLEMARSRAIQSGNPAGVLIQRQGTGSASAAATASRIRLLSPRPAYRGDTGEARALLLLDDNGFVDRALFRGDQNALLARSVLDIEASNGREPIRVGDRIQFQDGGRFSIITQITRLTSNDPDAAEWPAMYPDPNDTPPPLTSPPATPTGIRLRIDTYDHSSNSAANFPSGGVTRGGLVPYAIHRQPNVSSINIRDLVAGMAIDLNYSGIGPSGFDFSPLAIGAPEGSDFLPVAITFDSDGSVREVHQGRIVSGTLTFAAQRPVGTIFLCVGRADGVRADDLFSNEPRALANIMNPETIWVAINPFTGRISSVPAADVNVPMNASDIDATMRSALIQSRQFAFTAVEMSPEQ